MISEVREVKRVQQIISVLSTHEMHQLLSALNLRHSSKKSAYLSPQAVVEVLEELGGTFVKLGQFLSLRPDLIPYDYARALEHLQEEVKAFPSQQAQEIIRKELGVKSEQFAHIEPKPLASASIGQVYRAVLISGRQVAIKVMRPHIKDVMNTDILLLYKLAHQLGKKVHVINPTAIVDEFKYYTEQELDYYHEMQNIQLFDRLYASTPEVCIPTPLPKLCSEHVLTMDFLHGKTLHDHKQHVKAPTKKRLARQLVPLILDQIFEGGVFHADLHPGNIVLMTKKKIGLLDFGIVGRIDEHDRKVIAHLLFALVNKRLDGVVMAMRKLGMQVRSQDASALKDDLEQVLSPLYNVENKDVDLASLFISCLHVARQHGLIVPRKLVLLGKSVVTMKGLVDELDPSFNLTTALHEYASKQLAKERSLQHLADQGRAALFEMGEFATNIPRYGEEYLETNRQVEEHLSTLTREVGELSTNIRVATKEFFMLIFLIICFVSAFLLWNTAPFIAGYSLMSAFFVLVGVLIGLRMIRLL